MKKDYREYIEPEYTEEEYVPEEGEYSEEYAEGEEYYAEDGTYEEGEYYADEAYEDGTYEEGQYYEEGTYELQWQYMTTDWHGNYIGEWTDLSGENGMELEVIINEENALRAWRVVINEI